MTLLIKGVHRLCLNQKIYNRTICLLHKDLNYSISLIRDFYKLRLHKGGGGQIKAILCKLFGGEVYDMEGDDVKKYCNYANAIYVHSLNEFFLPCGPWMDSSGIWKAWWCMPKNSPEKDSEY